jgi:hypothetical protein
VAMRVRQDANPQCAPAHPSRRPHNLGDQSINPSSVRAYR